MLLERLCEVIGPNDEELRVVSQKKIETVTAAERTLRRVSVFSKDIAMHQIHAIAVQVVAWGSFDTQRPAVRVDQMQRRRRVGL
jgi:hypothetical protein